MGIEIEHCSERVKRQHVLLDNSSNRDTGQCKSEYLTSKSGSAYLKYSSFEDIVWQCPVCVKLYLNGINFGGD